MENVPDLTGTEAQLPWATEVRDRLILALTYVEPDDPQAAKVHALVRRHRDAGYWIRHRDDLAALAQVWEAAGINQAGPGAEDVYDDLPPWPDGTCIECRTFGPRRIGTGVCSPCYEGFRQHRR